MNFIESFENPPHAMSPVPFWLMNDELSEENIRYQLSELKKKHIHAVIPHPRSGMEVAFLSAAFWAKMDFIIEACRECAMGVILYDDYNFPSGTIGGKLMREQPRFRQRYLDYTIFKGRGVMMPVATGDLVAAFEVHPQSGTAIRITDLQTLLRQGHTLSRSDAELIVFFTAPFDGLFWGPTGAAFTRAERGYIDLLNPEAVRYYMDTVHEEYRRRYGRYFGSTITGLFTDEPAHYRGLMWTDRFAGIFSESEGFDLIGRLYQLAYAIGDDYPETRLAYNRCASGLYSRAYYTQIGEWCRANRLAFTGHLFYEEDLLNQPARHGSFTATLGEMDMPGLDYLLDRTGYEKQRDINMRSSVCFAPKMVTSIAHANGGRTTLCEVFGGASWRITLSAMRRVTGWLAGCGIGLVNTHSVYMSLKGFRKRDFPAAHFAPAPFWDQYQQYSDFAARLCAFNRAGSHRAQIAILFPQTALSIDFTLHKKSREFTIMKNQLPKIGDLLLRIQCDYDYLFEEYIAEGRYSISDGAISAGAASYRVLIIPPAHRMPIAQYRFVLQFYQSGGAVVFLGNPPIASERRDHDPAIAAITAALFGADKPVSGHIYRNIKNGRLIIAPASCMSGKPKVEAVFDRVLQSLGFERDIVISGARRDFIYQHRTIDGDECFLVVNAAPCERIVDLRFSAAGFASVHDPENGAAARLGTISGTANAITLRFTAGQALIVRIGNQALPVTADYSATIRRSNLPPLPLKPQWDITPTQDNLYLFDHWDYTLQYRRPAIADEAAREEELWRRESKRLRTIVRLSRPLFRMLDGAKTRNSMFSTTEALDAFEPMFRHLYGIDLYEHFADAFEMMDFLHVLTKKQGFNYRKFEPGDRFTISKSFTIKHIPHDLSLVYEDLGMPLAFSINGKDVSDREIRERSTPVMLWDRCNRSFPIGPYLHRGANRFAATIELPDIPIYFQICHGIEPMVLKGDFSVRNDTLLPPVRRIKSVPWEKAGFPNYSGAITYCQDFMLPQRYCQHRLTLRFQEIGEIASAHVNGKPAGNRPWPPYDCDISALVQSGKNRLEVEVKNTLGNIFENSGRSGIIGAATIVPTD